MKKKIKFKKFTLVIDEDRAREVFAILQDYWVSKKGVFSGVILPQDRFPLPKDKFELAHYLFFAALPMRGGVNSDEPFRWMWYLYQQDKGLFHPEKITQDYSQEKIVSAYQAVTRKILSATGRGDRSAGVLGYKMEQHANSWMHNAHSLVDYWQGDVRNIFSGTENFEQAYARIDRRQVKTGSIAGMRRKIFSLFAIWLIEKDLLRGYVGKATDYNTPIPVDFHCLRILWSTKVIDFINTVVPVGNDRYAKALQGRPGVRINENIMDAIAWWAYDFLPQNNFSFLAINPAIWVLSRDLCKYMKQNQSKEKGKFFYPDQEMVKNPGLWSANGRHPCWYCPLEELCTGAVPAQPYYSPPGILVRLERVPHPQQTLTDLMKDLNWSEQRLRGNGIWKEEINNE